MKTPIRLVLADDHRLFRQGLRSLLRLQEDLEVVAEVERASDLLPTLATVSCDVLLLDLQMDRWVLGQIGSLAKVTRVVVLTASERTEDGLTAIRLGARAFVHKRFAIETVTEAIRAAADGMVWMPPTLQAELTSEWSNGTAPRLTERETEIVRHVALGLRNAEVAAKLSIGEGTVKTHLNKIFDKLGLRDRVELTRYAFRTGLVSVHE